MADHLQDQILTAIKATLATAATAAGNNVFIDGVDPAPATDTDRIEIEAGPEISQPHTIGFPPNRLREFTFTLRLTVIRTNGWRAAAGTLLKQCEAAIAATTSAFTAGGKATGGIHYLSTDMPEKDGSGDRVVYCIPAQFVARYRCNANTPDTPT